MSQVTTSQTIGPFPHEAWRWAFVPEAITGAVVIEGRVFDGAGVGIDDAHVEAWLPQGDAVVDGLPGLQRVPTGADGVFRLAVPQPAAGAPAAYVVVFARGLTKHQFSAVFLPGAADGELLAQVPAERRATLIARADGERYRWDIRLQGTGETVFFDFE
jgi:protocatechuate 3,4-dioxygenase alpha subunit